ncbi:MAG: trigger factor [Flavobacteriaceae bacterium]|nr:trigger factor [Flavobacteriaceae bacterium]
MNITKQDTDSLNAVLTVEILKDDYAEKVQKVLNDYRKNANIPGFRKGHIPMGMIRKQYGRAILVDEVNKLLQESLHKYLTEEKLDILGNPLPKNETEIDWNAENFNFEFELGLSPKFEVDLKGKKTITHYKIEADQKMIDNQVSSIRKQYGKLISQTDITKGSEVTGTFVNADNDIDNKATFEIEKIKGKKQLDLLLNSKVGDTVSLKTKGLFAEDYDYNNYLKVPQDDAKTLDIEVAFSVEEVNLREMAVLNQDLFDKIFGKDAVSSEEEFKAKIKDDSEKQFLQQADQKLLNDITESLIENTKFDLPAAFLQKWIQVSGEKPMTEEEANDEYQRSEKGLRYQLIEGKLRAENNLQVSFDELKAYSKTMISAQMAQFGQNQATEEELDSIVARILSNEEEVKRLSEQLNNEKLLNFFKENAKLKTKKISFDKFIKEAY